MTLLSLAFSTAWAQTDTIGAAGTYGYQYGMIKLVEVQVAETAAVTGLEFALSNYGWGDEVELVAYVREGDHFSLVGTADASLAAGEVVWAQSGEVTWLLLAGNTYALGAYVGDGVLYFYQDDAPGELWFGEATGTYQVEGGVSDSIEVHERENHYYYMRVTSLPADADGDGGIAEAYGGDDCDDEDASVHASGIETAYDGIDQDCDGLDLTDADGDGVDGLGAGGEDCDDASAAVGPGLTEVCDDGVDQDCDGTDESCDGALDGPAVDASVECGCDAGGGAGLFAVALAALGLRRRK